MRFPLLRVGIVGAGGNTRSRHIPGLMSQPQVKITAVCNRRPSSTRAAAAEFAIPNVFDDWRDLISSPEVDAVVIGTWPFLHCPITKAALALGKHVLTEARMCMNAKEAHDMHTAALKKPQCVAQIVPSPYGLHGLDFVREMLTNGFIGELREVSLSVLTDTLRDPAAPLSWRQDVTFSGYNMLTLGIFHETLLRWIPRPVRVMAQNHAFIPVRNDPESGVLREVGTPDSVQAIATLESGARATYQLSGVMPFGQEMKASLHGSEGSLIYDFINDTILGGRRELDSAKMQPIEVPREIRRTWSVEADFVSSIRTGAPVELTDFETGVAYMEFTEAVAKSAATVRAIQLPFDEDLE